VSNRVIGEIKDLSSLTEHEAELVLAELSRDDFGLFWYFCWGQEAAAHHLEWHNMFAMPGVHDGADRLLIGAARGFAKALSLDTKIPTPDGWTTMGEISVGDKVFDENGNICNVVGVYDRYADEAYELEFSDGATIKACSDHLWITYTQAELPGSIPPDDWAIGSTGEPPIIRTTRDIVDTIHHCHYIPFAKPVDGYNNSSNGFRTIVGARKIESQPMRCIMVDSPSEMFLAGEAMIPTHNTTFSIRRILFEIGHNPDLLITIVTADDALGVSILHEIASNILGNRRLQMVFPELQRGEPWSKTRITVKRNIIHKEPTIKAAGLFSTGVGGRANLMLFDDCTSYRTAVEQPAQRETSKRIFHEVWMNHLLPDGRVLYICTPWHTMDLSMDLRRAGTFVEWWRPALDENGESIWPEMWPTEKLERKRAEDARSFEQQYMLRPISELDTIFNFETILMGAGDDAVPREDWRYYVGVDLAPAMGSRGSYSVIFVIGVDPRDPRHTRHVVDIIRTRGKAPEVMSQIIDVSRNYSPECIMVENNAYQQAMVDFLEAKDANIPVMGYRTGSQKLDLKQGVPAISPLFARGLFKYPVPPEHFSTPCNCPICIWINELKLFPGGERSDTVMAMWLAERAFASARDALMSDIDGNLIYLDEDFEPDDDDEDDYTDIKDADDGVIMVDWM